MMRTPDTVQLDGTTATVTHTPVLVWGGNNCPPFVPALTFLSSPFESHKCTHILTQALRRRQGGATHWLVAMKCAASDELSPCVCSTVSRVCTLVLPRNSPGPRRTAGTAARRTGVGTVGMILEREMMILLLFGFVLLNNYVNCSARHSTTHFSVHQRSTGSKTVASQYISGYIRGII